MIKLLASVGGSELGAHGFVLAAKDRREALEMTRAVLVRRDGRVGDSVQWVGGDTWIRRDGYSERRLGAS